ncbi:MAG: DUF86 domain-containing protein [Vampirovibrionales bacterium]
MPKRYPDLILQDMLEFIQAIQTFCSNLQPEQLLASRLHRDAIIRNLELLGEAANQLPKALQEAHPHIPWKHMIALRNKLIHEYHGVNWDILLPTILNDLPPLQHQLQKLYDTIDKNK